MLEGLLNVLDVSTLSVLTLGVLMGILVGALPGFTATMGTALLLPFAFTMSTENGLAMLGGLYIAAMFSDAIPACLVNTPGTPAAMATGFDGYPMTQRGEGQRAIVAAGFSSMVGATLGGLTFLLLSAPLTIVALRFGPPEFFWIGIFALTIIGSISGTSLLKGIMGGIIGLLIGTIGISVASAVSRYTFGVPSMRGGINVVAALIGVFALPQVLTMIGSRRQSIVVAPYKRNPGVMLSTSLEIMRRPVNVIRSSIIGIVVGLLPGAGSPVASLVSYNEAVRWSKDKSQFGKGALDGVVASEAANSSAAGGALVPTLGLGVPGSAPAAVIMGALVLKGIQPGPQLLTTNAPLVYGFAWAVIIAGFVTFILGSALSGGLARMVTIPIPLLAPIVLFLSISGSYAIRSNLVDVYLMVAFGLLVYAIGKFGISAGPIGLGVIMGPIVEPYLVQAISMTRAKGWAATFLFRPVSATLILITILSMTWVAISNRKERHNDLASA
jgi:putative tricarboxylic transport membrane protein